ncbi:hypothetical protein PU629_16895 [Pullulanibacillus sp. KACC 23026]|uniref:hypothetical protein n=1 Tax=Pullulanibacillus sp. KACC 23026 TaxID=3028315 RepID=UPI0023B02A09|nr:hypothetical protein [Pullulanibacillus sp. KACC 23026]WEG11803.1 hypothetical protein PU629_16895 [Pullulanibacillus sp. KACC 23026]
MKLPFLLSGPILRRAYSKSVVIWLAMSEAVTIQAALFPIQPSTHRQSKPKQVEEQISYEPLSINTTQHTCRLGDHLYIYLIELTPNRGESFPVDCFLGYNLSFIRNSETVDLGDLGLLTPDNPDSIVYEPFSFPTFILKEKETTNFLYGSCRKFHGKGQDLLPKSDDLMAKKAANLEERPHTLFLLGDQIYADDVASAILPFLSELGTALHGGKQEDLSKLDQRLLIHPFPKALKQAKGRQFIMNEFAGFTSTHAANHLMTFGEYAAMYLMNWSPTLWKVLTDQGGLPSFKDLIDKGLFYQKFPDKDPAFRKQHKTELKQAAKDYRAERELVSQFASGLPAVRRLLANIPTYMIFDDHDITDDWNLSHSWKTHVSESALGSHIIGNALTAYWAFQGWGNEPEAFSPAFIETIEQYLTTLKLKSYEHDKWLKSIMTFNKWSYVSPTHPKALFLDTRTMRGYDPVPQPVQIGRTVRETPMSSELISQKGLAHTEQILKESGWKKETPLLIISATPLYGIQLIENFVLKYIYPFRSFGLPVDDSFDIEAWKDNGKGFTQFINHLKKWEPSPCIILSGDVHYGFQAESKIRFQSEKSKEQTIYQLTSSPINNMSFYGWVGLLLRCVTRLHAPLKKRKEIHHYCDKSYRLIAKKQLINDPTTINWHEKIYYNRNQKGQIMETHNNIGLLTIKTIKLEDKDGGHHLQWTNQLLSE